MSQRLITSEPVTRLSMLAEPDCIAGLSPKNSRESTASTPRQSASETGVHGGEGVNAKYAGGGGGEDGGDG